MEMLGYSFLSSFIQIYLNKSNFWNNFVKLNLSITFQESCSE